MLNIPKHKRTFTPRSEKIKISSKIDQIKRRRSNSFSSFRQLMKQTTSHNIDVIDLQDERTKWTVQQERLLISWAEKASGYSWLHNKCINYYKRLNRYISIPASIFGYISGTATLLTSGVHNYTGITATIGICGILAGMLSNLQQMFTYKELSEQHRISSLRFQSFFRDISCELSLNPEYRAFPIDYIKMKRLELDKMLEQSPDIPEKIVNLFHELFKNVQIHKPENTNTLQTIQTYDEQNIYLAEMFNKRNKTNTSNNTQIEASNSEWLRLTEKYTLKPLNQKTSFNNKVQKTNKKQQEKGTVEIANSVHLHNDVPDVIVDMESTISNTEQNILNNQNNDNFMNLINDDMNIKNVKL